MIFTEEHAQMVLDGRKGQTRRPVKPGEYAVVRGPGLMEWFWYGDVPLPASATIIEVRDANGRLKWKVGKDYAAQTGRGKKAIGRTPPIEEIRRERLQEISEEDAKQEGPSTYDGWFETWKDCFRVVWDSLYPTGPYTWDKNPEVWALTFEKVQ